MSDDLLLLIGYIYEEQLCKMALKIKNGMNLDIYSNFKYYKETSVEDELKTMMDIEFDYIVSVEEIDNIEIVY